MALAVLGSTGALAAVAHAKIGGQTGDVLGQASSWAIWRRWPQRWPC
ncbi:hypothetical protein ACFSHQ_20140 [Gemmobacter lanyuensis]